MSGFQITITDAGRAALINAQNTGTVAFVLSEIGVSAQAIAGDLSGLTALPNERKRLATMAGDVVADDTLHVTIRDESADAYALRSFGLYASTGVLFAVYSQSDPILEKSAAAMLLLAVDARLVALGTANVEFGPAGFTLPPASETIAGVVEIATDAEVDAGQDPWRVITVRTLKRTLGALANFARKDHKHDAADVETGTFHANRIPELPMSRIAGLIAALADKASALHSHTMAQVSGLIAALEGKEPVLGFKPVQQGTGVGQGGNNIKIGWDGLNLRCTVDSTDQGAFIFADRFTTALALKSNLWTVNTFHEEQTFNKGLGIAGSHGTSGLFPGTGDGASYTTFNTKFRGWFGMGMEAYDGTINGFYDFRAGRWDTKRAPRVNGSDVWHPGNFNPDAKATLGVNAVFCDVIAARNAVDGVYYFGSDASRWLAYSNGRYELIGSGGLTINGYQAWTAEHFDAANLVTISATGLGKTGAGRLMGFSNPEAYGALPTGATTMVVPNQPGMPTTGYAYLSKIARRDNSNGYAALVITHAAAPDDRPEAWVGASPSGQSYAGWSRLWTDQNLRAASASEASAGVAGDRFITPSALWSFAKSIGVNGYQQIPGTDLIIQWGVSNGSHPEGAVHAALPVAFGGGCLFACATPRNAGQAYGMDFVMQIVGRYLDRIVFYANRANSSSGNMSGYEWMAVGLARGNPDPAYSTGYPPGGGGGGGGGEDPIFRPEV